MKGRRYNVHRAADSPSRQFSVTEGNSPRMVHDHTFPRECNPPAQRHPFTPQWKKERNAVTRAYRHQTKETKHQKPPTWVGGLYRKGSHLPQRLRRTIPLISHTALSRNVNDKQYHYRRIKRQHRHQEGKKTHRSDDKTYMAENTNLTGFQRRKLDKISNQDHTPRTKHLPFFRTVGFKPFRRHYCTLALTRTTAPSHSRGLKEPRHR